MAAEARALVVREYEPQAWAAYPGDGDERELDDEDVLRLLSGETGPTQLDHEHVDQLVAQQSHDALVPARGIAIGLALVIPFWLLVAALLM
jgi:hypothetical protein